MAEKECLKEYVDSPEDYAMKMSRLLSLMKKSKFTTVFTGAGISTAASIPDIRGEHGLETNQTPLVVLGLKEQDMDCILPTFSHCAIAELVKRGVVQFVATSNHDGLHQKSGLQPASIADVFGNLFVEKCLKCKREWTRSVVVPSLGRKCDDPACKGRLQKTGTRMGEATPEEPLSRATEFAKKSDLAIVLGSSLTVSPFCQLPFLAKSSVILNLQDTSYDKQADLSVHCYCDQAMRDICKAYGVELTEFRFCKLFRVVTEVNGDVCSLLVTGEKPNEPSGVVSCVEVEVERSGAKIKREMDKNMGGDFVLDLERVAVGTHLFFTFHFRENFNSPPRQDDLVLQAGKGEKTIEFAKEMKF